MGRDSFGAVSAGTMSDAELSRQLGRYQRQARTWLRVGLLGIAGGLIAAIAVENTALKAALAAVLFGGGLCSVLFLRSGAQKRLNALLREQLGDFFRAELEKTFGPALHTPEMQIDQPLLSRLCPPGGQWEECETENFREGSHRGMHFSAANVRLYHVYEQGHGQGSLGTSRDMAFKGVVLRCETRIPAPVTIRAHARAEGEPGGVLTGNTAFDRRFCVTAEQEQDAHKLLTPQFAAWFEDFSQRVEGKIAGFSWEDRAFSLLLETDYGFAAVAGGVDMRNLDVVRCSYRNSLRAMEETLDLLLHYNPLFVQQK